MTANRSASVGLAMILLVAAYFRLHNIDFGLPSLWDDDEPFFLMHGLKLLKAQTLNPGWFGHPGSTTIYLIGLCTMLVYGIGWLAGAWTTSNEFLTAIYADPALIMVSLRGMPGQRSGERTREAMEALQAMGMRMMIDGEVSRPFSAQTIRDPTAA